MFSNSLDVICWYLYQVGCVTKLTAQGLYQFQPLMSHTFRVMIKIQEWFFGIIVVVVFVLFWWCFILPH